MTAMKVIRRNLIITITVLIIMLFAGSTMTSGRQSRMPEFIRARYEQETVTADENDTMALNYEFMDSVDLNVG